MKKLLFSLAALGIATFGFAQEKANLAPASKAELTKTKKKIEAHQFNKGNTIFAEDFANGLAGNNGIGAWTAEDSEGGEIWHINTPQSPAGEFSSAVAALQSTTGANGWMIFDAGLHNTPISTGVVDLRGFLTTPSIDMTAEISVIVEFQQYFRYCCFGASPMSVEVSNDGGVSWISFPSNGTFIESANTFSDNALTTSIDISCAAAGEADVQIRWAYNSGLDDGYSHYFWGVDDISVFSNANTNDMAIDLVTNGDIFNFYEFRVLPMEQAIPAADGGLLVGTYFQNYGSANQSNVTVTVEVLDDAGTVLSTNTSAAFNLLSFANSTVCPSTADSVFIATGWEPDVAGDYTIRSTIVSADATDDTPEDNVVLKTIQYNEFTMGHDDPSTFDLELRQSTDADNNFQTEGFGSHYQMNNDGSEIYGIVVYFGPNTTPGTTVEARLYNTLGGFVDVDNSFVFIDYEVEPEDVPAGFNTPIPTFIEFQSSEPVFVGDTYFGAVMIPDLGEGELTVMSNANLDSDFSTAEIDLSGDQEFVWFNRPDVPAVRLAFGEFVGIEDLTLIDGVSSITNIPNPVTDMTTINYTLVNALEVNIEIVDITGKVVFSENQGTRTAGQHQLEIDATAFADGVYFYSLVSGDQRMTRKMVVTK